MSDSQTPTPEPLIAGHEFVRGSHPDECEFYPGAWADPCGQPESAHAPAPPVRRLIVGHPFLRCSMPAICSTPLLCHECDQPEQDHRESAPEPAPRQAVSQSEYKRLKAQGVEVACSFFGGDGLLCKNCGFNREAHDERYRITFPEAKPEAAGDAAEKWAERVLEGPLSEYCEHDKSSAYLHRYDCRPASWHDNGQGEGCLLTTLKREARALVEQATREAVIATQEDPEGEVALGVFAERQIRRGCSYDAKAGIWWKDDEKPGVLQELEAALAAERKARQIAERAIGDAAEHGNRMPELEQRLALMRVERDTATRGKQKAEAALAAERKAREEIQETLERWFQLGERVLKAAGNVWADTPLKAMDRIEARIRKLEVLARYSTHTTACEKSAKKRGDCICGWQALAEALLSPPETPKEPTP